jgi:hypothetical protein
VKKTLERLTAYDLFKELFGGAAGRSAAGNAGVGEDDVEFAELLADLLEDSLAGFGV